MTKAIKDPAQMSVAGLRQCVTKLRKQNKVLQDLLDEEAKAHKNAENELARERLAYSGAMEQLQSQLRILFSYMNLNGSVPTSIEQAVASLRIMGASSLTRGRILARFLGDRVRITTGDRPHADQQVPWSLRANFGPKFAAISGTLPGRPRS